MKYLFLFFATLLAFKSIGQHFEGKMVLNISFQSKMPGVSNEQLTALMGSRQEYYIKEGEYKSITNGSFVQWQLYVNADNKLYNKFGNSDTLRWLDGASNTDEVISAQTNKAVTKVLGYTCDELILTCKNSVQKFYYNPAFSANPLLYVNHKFGNWYQFISTSHALALKTIIESAEFVQEMVVTEVTPMKLDQSFFTLPRNSITSEIHM